VVAGFVERSLKLLNLLLGLLQAVLLDQHGLGKDVERVRISGKALLEVTLGIEVLVVDLRVADAFDEAVNHLLLLRCHGVSVVLRCIRYDERLSSR